MKAIILAGGQGTRLRNVLGDIPKPMAPIAGKPFLEYLIVHTINCHHIDGIIISIGYKSNQIKAYFKDGKDWNTHILYSEELDALGTGGAFKKAFYSIKDTDVILMNGDSFIQTGLEDLISFHHANASLATVGVTYVDDVSRYGTVQIDHQGKIINFTEKKNVKKPGFINCGIYIFNRKIINYLPEGSFSLETDVLPNLIGKGLLAKEFKGFFIDIGIPDDYFKLYNNPQLIIDSL